MRAATIVALLLRVACMLTREATSSATTNRTTLWKCCRKGEQLDARAKACVTREGWQRKWVLKEELAAGDPSAYWVPPWLRGQPLSVVYAQARTQYLDYIERFETVEDVEQMIVLARELRLLQKAKYRLDPPLVPAWRWCVDVRASDSQGEETLVGLFIAVLRPVPKCCARRQHLHASLRSCQAEPQRSGATATPNEEQEELVLTREALWLPRRLQGSGLMRARYDELRRFNWTRAVEADEEAWELLSMPIEVHPELLVLVGDAQARPRPPSQLCFDADPQGRHVLLARVTDLNKCCRLGEQLNAQLTQCVPREGHAVEQTDVGELTSATDAEALYWLPQSLRPSADNASLFAFYSRVSLTASYVFKEEDPRWEFGYDRSLGGFALSVQHGNYSFRSTATCFEAVSSGPLAPRVVLTVSTNSGPVIGNKCCMANQMLSPTGDCETSAHAPWSPLESAAASLFFDAKRAIPYVEQGFNNPMCRDTQLSVLPPVSPEHLEQLLRRRIDYKRFHDVVYCADFQRTEDCSVREVVASCDVPPSVWLYQAVRPLQVVAALLLALAVATVVLRASVRRTTHGRALAFHAASLMAANTLQATWFFTHERGKDCSYFAYVIYFFLVAAAFWLNVISINMARGFRRALGAPSSNTASRSDCVRLALASLWAWGGAAALTVLTVLMYHWRNDLFQRGVPVPSLVETRTCKTDTYYKEEDGVLKGYVDTHLGEVYYYFAPVATLVAVNAVCLVLTLHRVWQLQRDGDLLTTTTRAQRSALLYVKLLLTAGVAELAVEATAWGVRSRPTDNNYLQEATHYTFVFSVVGAFLDVVRAWAVLWLCVGGCRRSVGALWGRLRETSSPTTQFFTLSETTRSNVSLSERQSPRQVNAVSRGAREGSDAQRRYVKSAVNVNIRE